MTTKDDDATPTTPAAVAHKVQGRAASEVWQAANARRSFLIEKELRSSLTEPERQELEQLQVLAEEHLREVALLPLVELEAMAAGLRAHADATPSEKAAGQAIAAANRRFLERPAGSLRRPRELALAHLLVVITEDVASDQYQVAVWNAGTYVAETWRRLPVPGDDRVLEVAASALKTAGHTVPKDVPDLAVRIADNVLDESSWPVRELWFDAGVGRVVRVRAAQTGVYSFDGGPAVGWTLEQVVAWGAIDSMGRHPEEYHELAVPGVLPGLRWDESFGIAVLKHDIEAARKARAEKRA